jgi:hypothetical protein
MLLSGSVDKTAIVWDAKTGDVKQQFEFHSGEQQQLRIQAASTQQPAGPAGDAARAAHTVCHIPSLGFLCLCPPAGQHGITLN